MKQIHLVAIGATVGVTALLGLNASSAFAATYTTTQVAAHNTASDCWEIIDGKVYNVTGFVAQHSGGASVVLAQCGKNATAIFNSGPHSASSLNALTPFLVGDSAVGATNKPSIVLPAATVAPVVDTVAAAPVAQPAVAVSHEGADSSDDSDDSDDAEEREAGDDSRWSEQSSERHRNQGDDSEERGRGSSHRERSDD